MMEFTSNDLGSVVMQADPIGGYADELFTAPSGDNTYPAGTILARNTSTLKLIPYVKGGSTAGNGIPKAILTKELVTSAAGDTSLRALLGGKVYASRLVITADGDASNIDATVLDLLRDAGIIAVAHEDLSMLDNH